MLLAVFSETRFLGLQGAVAFPCLGMKVRYSLVANCPPCYNNCGHGGDSCLDGSHEYNTLCCIVKVGRLRPAVQVCPPRYIKVFVNPRQSLPPLYVMLQGILKE
jgi:hypothetical protein